MAVPNVTTTKLNSTSFDIDWTKDDSNYMHTFIVTWTATELCDTRIIGSVIAYQHDYIVAYCVRYYSRVDCPLT